MGMWNSLGKQLNTRQMMEQDLARVEDTRLDDAFAELQKTRGERNKGGGLGLMFNSPGASDYFRKQGNDSDAVFLRSILKHGERPIVEVGESGTFGGVEGQGGVKGGPFAAQKDQYGVTGGPFKSSHARADVQTVAPPQPANDVASLQQEVIDLKRQLQDFFLRQRQGS
jgi:hypothetical protein